MKMRILRCSPLGGALRVLLLGRMLGALGCGGDAAEGGEANDSAAKTPGPWAEGSATTEGSEMTEGATTEGATTEGATTTGSATTGSAMTEGSAATESATGGEGGPKLTFRVSRRAFIPSFGKSGPTKTLPLEVSEGPIVVTPATRVYLLVEHRINGDPPPLPEVYYHNLQYSLSAGCALDVVDDGVFTDAEALQVGPPLVDVTGGRDVVVDVEALGEGINVFDVTDVPLGKCGGATALEVLSNAPKQHFVQIGVTSNISWVHEIALYLGEA